jgi:DNA-binding NarL/FixJ family response regulator
MKKITVFLSDDHAVFREGLRLLLDATGEIDVIGEAEDGYRALRETRRLQPDVVLMDIAMPLLNGVEVARRIAREVPTTKVLILSTYGDDQHVQQAVNAGAAGYLMKQTASTDLLRAIRSTCKGGAFFSAATARGSFKHSKNGDPPAKTKAAPVLTWRQTEVLQLIAEGYSNKQMAALMFVSIKTVEKHRQALMANLDIHETATLTRYAVSTGVVECHRAPSLTCTVARWLAGGLDRPRHD